MSEVQPRPSVPRGRGSARGGRGGFSSRGARGGRGHATNGASADADAPSSIEADGEVLQLKKKFGGKVGIIKEMFPGWTDEDVVLALQETDGDIETTVDRITEGSITQWGEVSKNKKDRSKSKVKDASSTALGESTNQGRVSRGGRAGFDSGRGGRGRGTDRGRGGGRGRGGAAANTNGSRKENTEISVPTTDSTAWDSVPAASEDTPARETSKPADDGSSSTPTATTAAAAAVHAASTIIPDGVKKSWASMFAPAPAPKKAPEPVVEKPSEPAKLDEPIEPPTAEPEVSKPPAAPVESIETPPPQETADDDAITPSKDELTETNLEQVLDTSAPAPTATAASTAASSWDPRNTATSTTPYSALQQQPQAIRPLASGFQASALKATGSSTRTPSYQRRVLDQEEAVRMPGNREVDRAAVQFGAFNLSGNGDEDVDGDREDAETRAQPPQHSPVAPRAALPPGPQQPTAVASETLPTPKQAAGFPATTHPSNAPGLPSPAPLPSASAGVTPAGPQGNQPGQYGRYGQSGQETQKPYDSFGQQAPATQSPFDGYTNQPSQTHSQQPPSGAFSSAPGDFSSYYTADAQQRQAYNSYYQQQYGAQTAQGQDAPASQQRSYSGYNNGPQNAEGSPFPQSSAQQAPSRYATAGEGQNSGHTTPNPVTQGQHQASQGAQPQQPGHPQQPQVGGNYPYGHPYYSSPYYAAYMNHYQQYGGNYPGGPYGGKGGLHQQPYQGYAMSPGAPYEHASSPAGGAFGGASSLHGRDSALGGGSLGEYGRGGSAQSSQNPQGLGTSGTFGTSHDAFGRNSSYQGQNQYNTQQGTQQGSTDDLKPFSDSKSGNGPSPSLSQGGRPGSATNAGPGSALPPPQSQQGGGYGGYPSHLQQGHGIHGSQAGSQYGGLGGAGGHQAGGQGHQNSQYGGYGGFAGQYGGGYGNSQQRGGWGGNYGH